MEKKNGMEEYVKNLAVSYASAVSLNNVDTESTRSSCSAGSLTALMFMSKYYLVSELNKHMPEGLKFTEEAFSLSYKELNRIANCNINSKGYVKNKVKNEFESYLNIIDSLIGMYVSKRNREGL